tara:strand:- start:654 stop:1112 length:459 start_codon:yes stop_codon:yes gene_type:complete
MIISEINDFVDELKLNKNTFSIMEVKSIVENLIIDSSDFIKNLDFGNQGYKKILIYDHPLFDVYVIVWNKLGASKIHDHSENGCIFRIIKGILSEQIFDKNLVRLRRRVMGKDIMGYIDNSNGYHKILNILDDYSVSLHLYSPSGYVANTFD